jgi:hypothetical protein
MQLIVRQLHVGHVTALLERLQVLHPGSQFCGCIRRCACGQRLETHQVRQVWTEIPYRLRSLDGVAVDTVLSQSWL